MNSADLQNSQNLQNSNSVKIYSWFAGLGLPRDRIENLKKESQQQAAIASQKEKNRDIVQIIRNELKKCLKNEFHGYFILMVTFKCNFGEIKIIPLR